MPEPRYPTPPWADNGVPPTPAELETWLRAHDPAVHDARVAADLILHMLQEANARAAELQRALEGLRDATVELEQQVRRYRLAWRSAAAWRRRERDRCRWMGG